MTSWASLLPLGHAPRSMEPRRVRALDLMAAHGRLADVATTLGISLERCRQVVRRAVRDFVMLVDAETLLDSRRDEARIKLAILATRRRLRWRGHRRANVYDMLVLRSHPDYANDPVQDFIEFLRREAKSR